jgi:hypothetical protein
MAGRPDPPNYRGILESALTDPSEAYRSALGDPVAIGLLGIVDVPDGPGRVDRFKAFLAYVGFEEPISELVIALIELRASFGSSILTELPKILGERWYELPLREAWKESVEAVALDRWAASG